LRNCAAFCESLFAGDGQRSISSKRSTAHRAVYDQKSPFSEDEVKLIFAEARRLKGGTHGYARHRETFVLLLELMLETGMRVGDAVRFDAEALSKGGSLWIYTFRMRKRERTETPKYVDAYISDRLKTAIEKRHHFVR